MMVGAQLRLGSSSLGQNLVTFTMPDFGHVHFARLGSCLLGQNLVTFTLPDLGSVHCASFGIIANSKT